MGLIQVHGRLSPRGKALLCLALIAFLAISMKNFVEIINIVANLVEKYTPDWHCGQEGLEAQCDGGMIIAHIMAFGLTCWTIIIVPIFHIITTIVERKRK